MAAASWFCSFTSARVLATRALARREVQSLALGSWTPNAIGTSVAPRVEISLPDAAGTPRQVQACMEAALGWNAGRPEVAPRDRGASADTVVAGPNAAGNPEGGP
jgi:hypothetical protein